MRIFGVELIRAKRAAQVISPDADSLAPPPSPPTEERAFDLNNLGQFLLRNIIGYGSEKGRVIANTRNILAVAAAYACIKRVSQDVAGLPKGLFRTSENARTELREHPASWVISHEPNLLCTAHEFFSMLVAHAMINAAAYAYIERDKALRPATLHLLNPENVEEIYTDGGRQRQYRIMTGVTPWIVDEFDMIRLPAFYNQSVVQMLNEAFGLSLTIQGFASQYFSTNGNIKLWMKHPGPIIGNKQVQQQLSDAYAGKLGPNANGVPIIGDGMDVKELKGSNLSESQAIEARKYQFTEVCAIFGVPPSLVGAESQARYQSPEMMMTEYVQGCLQPWVQKLEQELTRKLLYESEKKNTYVRCMLQGLMRGDMKARSEYYRNMVGGGIMTPDESRALEELPPIAGGNKLRVPINFIDSQYFEEYSKMIAEGKSKTSGGTNNNTDEQ